MSLKQNVQMYKSFSNMKELVEKVEESYKEIKITSLNDLPELKEKILNFRGYQAVPKECYKNALELTLKIDGVEYVEGLMGCQGLPISHAWNVWNGHYFDVTMDLNDRLREDEDYLAFFNVDKMKLQGYMIDLGYYGAFTLYHFLNIKQPFNPLGI